MLEIRNVHAGYGNTPVLRGISLEVPTGGVVAILGPNGAGKTTLLRTISGLLPASAGRVLFEGDDITALAPFRRAQCGICQIPEGGGVFTRLTVRENLVLMRRECSEQEAFERATSIFPVLATKMNRRAGTLSGGEQRMLAFARAYIGNARVVLADEISLGLAPLMVDRLFESLRRLVADGIALVLVEQYVKRALELSEDVCVLKRGELVFQGKSADLDEASLATHYLGQ